LCGSSVDSSLTGSVPSMGPRPRARRPLPVGQLLGHRCPLHFACDRLAELATERRAEPWPTCHRNSSSSGASRRLGFRCVAAHGTVGNSRSARSRRRCRSARADGTHHERTGLAEDRAPIGRHEENWAEGYWACDNVTVEGQHPTNTRVRRCRSPDPSSWKRSTPIVLTSGQRGPTTRRNGPPRFRRFLGPVYSQSAPSHRR
jgi:hypothetical protein